MIEGWDRKEKNFFISFQIACDDGEKSMKIVRIYFSHTIRKTVCNKNREKKYFLCVGWQRVVLFMMSLSIVELLKSGKII